MEVYNKYISTQKIYIKMCEKILKDIFLKRSPYYYMHSYGCLGNVSEGEKIEGILKQIGFSKTKNSRFADIIVLNSCAIRAKAEDKFYSSLGEILNFKKISKNKIVCVCGCMVQQKHVKEKIEEKFPLVDLIFGPNVIYKFPEFIYNILTKKSKHITNISSKEIVVEGLPVLRNNKIKALVPISYGCNNFCTYCIVPYVKGRERSRKFENIIKEVKNLIEDGYKEVILLGQNVNSYGKDLNLKDGFSKLLNKINEIEGDFIVRFMTSHPKDFSKELIDTIVMCDKVCKNFHLPVQSGCNRILKLMNRKYIIEDYIKIIDYIKNIIPSATFSTDIIVGFPGETYEEFKKTLELIKKIRYIHIYNFIYSKRIGTVAAKFDDNILKKEKSKWLGELIKTQNKISFEINKSYVGKTEKVLFEGVLNGNEECMVGRTNGNILVTTKKNLDKIGEFCNVKIIDAKRTVLIGEII